MGSPAPKMAASTADVAAEALVTPSYWDEACKHLAKRDRVMRKLVADHGHARLYSRGDAFTTLARSIVGQQISVKAAQSVWNRLLALLGHDDVGFRGPIPVADVLRQEPDGLRQVGLSARKVDYLRDLALHFDENRLHVDDWQQMGDEAIIDELVAIRGIGRWTAEMFLIFHMQRPDVLPLDDIGLQRAISRYYNDNQPIDKKKMKEIALPWRPWRSVATWYLWRALDPLPVEY